MTSAFLGLSAIFRVGTSPAVDVHQWSFVLLTDTSHFVWYLGMVTSLGALLFDVLAMLTLSCWSCLPLPLFRISYTAPLRATCLSTLCMCILRRLPQSWLAVDAEEREADKWEPGTALQITSIRNLTGTPPASGSSTTGMAATLASASTTTTPLARVGSQTVIHVNVAPAPSQPSNGPTSTTTITTPTTASATTTSTTPSIK
jgi:hypothetical protein